MLGIEQVPGSGHLKSVILFHLIYMILNFINNSKNIKRESWQMKNFHLKLMVNYIDTCAQLAMIYQLVYIVLNKLSKTTKEM